MAVKGGNLRPFPQPPYRGTELSAVGGGGGGGEGVTEYLPLAGNPLPHTDRRNELERDQDSCLLVACLLAPSNMRVYLRDGSAQTVVRAATWKVTSSRMC